MTVSKPAGAKKDCEKIMKFTLSLFGIVFCSSKCKTTAKMAVARIKLLRNKRQAVVKQIRRDVALLLESGQDSTARIRVEHVIREQNIMAANEILELFCELIVARLSIISKRRECPDDLKEGICSLIFAAPRCSDIPELCTIRDIFEKKYGKDFVSAAIDLRPSSGVNRMLIDKLSVRTPSGEVKLKVMKEIAKEYQINWDTTESEMELLKPPEAVIEGPTTFVSTTSMLVKCATPLVEPNIRRVSSSFRSMIEGEKGALKFQDAASAAAAAAESAKDAISAAQAAAYLANRDHPYQFSQFHEYDKNLNSMINNNNDHLGGDLSLNPTASFRPKFHPNFTVDTDNYQGEAARNQYEPQSFVRTYYNGNEVEKPSEVQRRHSYNVTRGHTGIKFDESESDCDEEIEIEESPSTGTTYQAPDRPAPTLPSATAAGQEKFPRAHPKSPDSDLAARFESLKHPKSQK